ncbi:MAG: TolB family protein, partial [Pirellula sp.]
AMSGAILDSPQGDSSLRMQSSDGRYLVFVSNSQNLVAVGTLPPGMQQVYRYDRVNQEVVLVSVASDGVNGGNGKSDSPTISADGTRVAFRSEATNLSLMDQDNYPDIYVRELGNQPNTILASVNNTGTSKGNGYSFNPRISANGSRVVFHSYSTNIDPMDVDTFSDIYVRDLELPATYLVLQRNGLILAKIGKSGILVSLRD